VRSRTRWATVAGVTNLRIARVSGDHAVPIDSTNAIVRRVGDVDASRHETSVLPCSAISCERPSVRSRERDRTGARERVHDSVTADLAYAIARVIGYVKCAALVEATP
jgi:hypothetical protein